jgi:hypothetical protein
MLLGMTQSLNRSSIALLVCLRTMYTVAVVLTWILGGSLGSNSHYSKSANVVYPGTAEARHASVETAAKGLSKVVLNGEWNYPQCKTHLM